MPDLHPILEFDGTDEDTDQVDGNVDSNSNTIRNRSANSDKRSKTSNKKSFKPTEALVRRQGPTFLLIESLIWNFCCYNEKDKQKQKNLFLNLCQRLEDYKIIGKSYRSHSLQPIREFIAIKFKELVSQIKSNEKPFDSILLSCDPIPKPILNSSHLVEQSSRFSQEFIDFGLIEEGGFGIVNKAKYRFDDCEYAVKMIRFKYKSDTDLKKITREVHLYALVSSHPNVVAYKTAWLENWCLHNQKIPLSKHLKANKDNNILIETEISNEESIRNVDRTENDDSICFEESSKSGLRIEAMSQRFSQTFERLEQMNGLVGMASKDCADEEEDEESSDDSNSDCEESDYKMKSFSDLSSIQPIRKKTFSMSSTTSQSDSEIEYKNGYELQMYDKNNIPDIEVDKCPPNGCPFSCSDFGAILYIQMELCGKNLKTFLRERNERLFLKFEEQNNSGNILDLLDVKEAKCIFRQVLKGVEYIHSQHLIHRDLKPQNILMSTDGSSVKIGDFGLATIHNSLDNEEIALNYKQTVKNNSTGDHNHTGGIGTSIYAAPEQKLGKKYDNKTDLYSLGIILFELFYPLSTDMEKVKCVSNITKKRILPKSLQTLYPNVAKIILQLTHQNPVLRPNAAQVLHSSLFISEELLIIRQIEEQNKQMVKELVAKDHKIKELENRLAIECKRNVENDNKMEEMRKQIEELTQRLKFVN